MLLLSPPADLHAQAVASHLHELRVDTRWWSADNLLSSVDASVSCRLQSGGQISTILHDATIEHQLPDIDMSAVNAVWLRRPGTARSRMMPERWIEQMVEWETMRALEGIWRAHECFWINPPAQQTEALHKVWQLQQASACGFQIPRTLITNSSAQAEEFLGDSPERYIYKLIDEASWRFFPQHQGPKGMPTMPLRSEDLPHIDQVSASMHLFQERIDKEFDIRVTVVGEQLFAAAIHSQTGQGQTDFRLDYSVPITSQELPPELHSQCLELMKRLGLVYSAMDFAFSKSGEYVFFELNPGGQYLWIEQALGLPISLELAKLLSSKKP